MKKVLFYVSPFFAYLALMGIIELLRHFTGIEGYAFVTTLFSLSFLFSAAYGFFSPSKRKFDYLLTLLLPLASFLFWFLLGYFSKSDLETRYDLSIAVDVSLQPFAVLEYAIMAFTTFFFSFGEFRSVKRCFRKKRSPEVPPSLE